MNSVNNVPLKSYRVGPDISYQDLQRLQRHSDGLNDFVPIQLIEHNVDSNAGLANVLLQLSESYQFDSCSTYSLCKVDVNIFWRLHLVRPWMSKDSRMF